MDYRDRKETFSYIFSEKIYLYSGKIVPEYKTPYLRKFGGIKVTGSAINMALFKGG